MNPERFLPPPHVRRILPFLLVLPLLFPCIGCDDDAEGTRTGRFVYYVNGDVRNTAEFRRYDIDGVRNELQSSERVVSLSNVAANGIMLFETRQGAAWAPDLRLWGRCDGGEVIPVPLPVSPDPAEEYVYGPLRGWSGEYPAPALAHDGHHAAFFAWRRPVGSSDSTKWSLHLCIFNCSEWKMSTTDISAFLRDHYTGAGSDFRPDIPVPKAVAIANDGSVAAMQLMVQHKGQRDPVSFRPLLLMRTQQALRVLEESVSWMSAAFDPSTGWLLVSYADGGGKVHERHGSSWDHAHKSILNGFHALSGRSGESVVYSYAYSAFLLYRPTDGRLVQVHLDRERLESHFPDVSWLFGSIRIDAGLSPDGQWIVFTAEHGVEEGLYIMHRDGTGLRRVARGKFAVLPVVSDVVAY